MARVRAVKKENKVVVINRDKAYLEADKLGLPSGPLSYTQISTYQICPKSYSFRYVQKLPFEGWSANLVIGHAMHAGLESVNTAKMSKQNLTSVAARHMAHVAFDNDLNGAYNSNPAITKNDQEVLAKMGQLAHQTLDVWCDKFLPKINPVGVEEKIYVLANGIPLVVIIDLDDGGIVKDFKVTRRKKSDKDAEQSLQLSLYAAIKNASYAGFISCPFPELNKKKFDPTPVENVVRKNPGDREWALEVLGSVCKSILNDVNADHFALCDPASFKCSEQFCEAWKICRGRFFPPIEKVSWIK